MARGLRLLLIAAALAWLSTACSKAADEQRSAERQPAPEPATTSPAATGETGDTEPAAELEEVIEIAGAEPELTANTVPITPVTPSAVSVAWREVASPSEPLEFIYVASGVVARSSAGIHTLDKRRNLVLQPELELPPGSLLGRWPDDLWLVEATPIDGAEGEPSRFGYRLLRLDGERWVPQPVKREERWVGEPLAVRKGWNGGLLIREGSSLTRLGSRKPAPRLGVRMAKTIVDVIESSSGRVYTISSRRVGLYVQGSCSNLKCVNENAKKLPFGSAWSFSIQVPRQRHSLSMVASVDDAGASTSYLLHFGLGGWKLEPMSSSPSGLWASADGGLWVLIDTKLLYRTEHGDWYEVAPPQGAGKISVAMLGDASELWLATTVAGKPRVFATAGIVEAGD